MDSRELTEWEALYMIEPLPEDRADLRAGSIASATLAPHMKRGATPPQPKDFMPDYDAPPKPVQSLASMKTKFATVKKMFKRKREGK